MATSTERVRRMRERRKAALLPAEDQEPRPASELLLPAVAETLSQLELGVEHAGAVQLAKRYAQVIDQAKDQSWAMRWIGPLLLACLAELQATPMSRQKAPPGPQGPNRLDQLRASRVASDRNRGRL